jgi:DNA polymerase III delta prime subunit
MQATAAVKMARAGRLYPALILHGGSIDARRATATELARVLLCERDAEGRPCGECRHCRRIDAAGGDRFHPDFQVLERDLRTVTSVEATKRFVETAQVTPFEARGQVFVIASAESLSPGAADALLKSLEEPHESSPRHFLLLAPSQFDLSPTLRSRSQSIYLGATEALDEEPVARLAAATAARLEAYWESGAAVELMAAASVIEASADWKDPRGERPWAQAAAALVRAAEPVEPGRRRRMLDLAAALLEAPPLRLRGISPRRILEGLVFRHLRERRPRRQAG